MTLDDLRNLPLGYAVTRVYSKTNQIGIEGSKPITRSTAIMCRSCAIRLERIARVVGDRVEIHDIAGTHICKEGTGLPNHNCRGTMKGPVSQELITAKIVSCRKVQINRQGYEIGNGRDSGLNYYGVGQTLYRVWVECFNSNEEYVEETRADTRQDAINWAVRKFQRKGFTFKYPLSWTDDNEQPYW